MNVEISQSEPKLPNLKKLLNTDMVKEHFKYKYKDLFADNIILQINN